MKIIFPSVKKDFSHTGGRTACDLGYVEMVFVHMDFTVVREKQFTCGY
jgi:hypothetical protein